MPLSKIVAKSITDDTITTDQIADTSVHGRRNLIINGGMTVAERQGTTTINNSQAYSPVDRFQGIGSSGGIFDITQSTTSPDGFKNSLKVEVTTADSSIGASEYYVIDQRIEGSNIPQLAWGTSAAKDVTLSFWVRSSVTGTHGGAVSNSAANRSYPFTYTISAADTWEYKTIAIDGDTSGTWLTTTGVGIRLYWGLGAGATPSGTAGAWGAAEYRTATGAVQLIGTANATWYMTGAQLEVGIATPFEHRSFSEELQLCRRYFYAQQPKGLTSQATNDANCILGTSYGANNVYAVIEFQTEMRVYPAVSSGGTWYARANNSISFTGAFGTQRRGRNNYTVGQTAGSHSAGATLWCEPGNGSYLYFDAEL